MASVLLKDKTCKSLSIGMFFFMLIYRMRTKQDYASRKTISLLHRQCRESLVVTGICVYLIRQEYKKED